MFFVLKLSKLCNLRCEYCYEYEELAMKDRIPLAKFEVFIHGLAEFYVEFYRERKMKTPLTFVFHGGEPFLNKPDYLRSILETLRKHLQPASVPYLVATQTNLTLYKKEILDLFVEYGVNLGVSLDVFGGLRTTVGGMESQDTVLRNLQRLYDDGYLEALNTGGITVLTSRNIGRVLDIYEFYMRLGMSFRMLPVFNQSADRDFRAPGLEVSHARVLAAYKQVAQAQMQDNMRQPISPIEDYFKAAVIACVNGIGKRYDPWDEEYALIINTNGDTYSDGDTYSKEGFIGNIYEEPFSEIYRSERRKKVCEVRELRAQTCRLCPYDQRCNQMPMAECKPSERKLDAKGKLICSIARPMIDFYVELLNASPEAQRIIDQFNQDWEMAPQDRSRSTTRLGMHERELAIVSSVGNMVFNPDA
jgi:uncharacterized protein